MSVNKIDVNNKWYNFLQLAAEAKMRNAGLSETSNKNNFSQVIEKQSPKIENKDYSRLSILNNSKYVNNENKNSSNKILGTKFDAYA